MDSAEKRVRVFVRVKPTANLAQDMIKFGPDNKSIHIFTKKDAQKGVVNNQQTSWSFRLDGVLHHASQDQAYELIAKKLVSEALTGYNGTIICYGQIGAGKTYTMMGSSTEYQQRGIIPRALHQVFEETSRSIDPHVTIQISYLEIYNETLVDLLSTATSGGTSDGPMVVVDCPRGVYVKGLSVHLVDNESDALHLLFEAGEINRTTAKHTMNKNSSRSHCIFTIYIKSHFRFFSDARCINSKICLVDLAGLERLSKTGMEDQLLKEATFIKKSLLFIEQIIMALADPKRDHVPFRQSKLTHVLKDLLGGNCNMVLVTNICGEVAYMEETLSSLRFATRMKQMRTQPVINKTSDCEETVKQLEKEISLLKQELAMRDSLVSRSLVTYDPLTDVQREVIKSQVHKYLQGAIDEIDIMSVRQVQEVFKQFKQIISQQECEVETRLRASYVLVDKNDFAAVSTVQKVISSVDAVDDHLGQEEDQGDFVTRNPSPNPLSPKHGRKRKSRRSNEQPRKDVTVRDSDNSSPSKSQEIASTKNPEVEEEVKKQDAANIEAESSQPAPSEYSQRPPSPPPKPEAFELFKKEGGSEISRILKENKRILLARKTRHGTLARRMNSIKREIEDIQNALEAQKQERCLQGAYIEVNGQIIIDENEFLLIMKLKDLKEEYRSGRSELQDLKAEIQDYQRLVDQCQHKIISEFEIWYSESFLIPRRLQEALKRNSNIRPGIIPINRVMCLDEDEQDRFEQMQETTLPGCPTSVSFYRAKMKTDLKHSYIRTITSLKQMQKKRGVIT
ncbi:KIF9 protein, partial [Rhinopomastus cyanomelas]|nr:KIF9 protein [Rhinopomastus cyanomelas]